MSDPTKAVFLSYASQDAEAAKRICEALRAAGVEVWFDQSELRGGDSWDAKIRKQIKECALFVPVISQHTHERQEGYFRLEWRLADQRTHLMSRDRAFLIPVSIDSTPDQGARVPDSFTEVQWTKLPGGETPAAFAERVRKLLAGETTIGGTRTAAPMPVDHVPGRSGVNKWWWALPIFGVTMALLLVMKEGRKAPSPPTTAEKTAVTALPVASLDPKVAEARALVAKAQPLHENLDSNTRADCELAEEMFKRAIELAPLDAEVWAHYSWFGNNYVGLGLDRTPARLAEVKLAADRALKLDPKSDMALFSWGNYYRREPASLDEAVRILQELVARRPDFLTARRVLALGLSNQKKYDEALAATDYLSAHDPGDTRTSITRFGILLAMGRPVAEAEVALDASLAIKPTPRVLVRKALLLTNRGDMAGAAAILARVPPAFQQEDRVISVGVRVALAQRQPARVREILAPFPRDYMEEAYFSEFSQPKAMALGFASWIEGKPELARVEWQEALRVVDERLATRRTDGRLHYLKTLLHAMLGQEKEAEAAFRLYAQITPSFNGSLRGLIELWLGRQEKVLDVMETWTITPRQLALWRADPAYAPLWGNPRFEALKANAAETPAASPSSLSLPGLRSLGEAGSPSTLSVADSKSVAVLAFANLSDDKANEYFSDGISEELLNVLAKVPGLTVKGRSSGFFFKGKATPVPEIAQQLGVTYVVQGSVRKAGNRVRISAQLIRAASDEVVWSSGSLDRDLQDIFAVQDEIAGLVAQQLQLKLGVTTPARVVDPEAHRLLLEARHYWHLRGEQNFDRTEALLHRALAIDPDFAPAHAAMADLWVMRAAYRATEGADVAEELRALRTSAARATQLDPSLVSPIAATAYGLLIEGRMPAAQQQFEAAVALSPNDPTVRFWQALFLMQNGDFDGARREFAQARELDPKAWIITHLSGQNALLLGRREEALALLRQANADRPDGFAPAVGYEAIALWQSGRSDEAVAAARAVRQSWPTQPRWQADAHAVWVLRQAGLTKEVAAYADMLFAGLPAQTYQRGFMLAALGRFDEALPYLERTTTLALDPFASLVIFDPWREDHRFKALLEKLHWTEQYAKAREAMKRSAAAMKP